MILFDGFCRYQWKFVSFAINLASEQCIDKTNQ